MLRYLTAGESHGSCLTTIIEGIPAHLFLKEEEINIDLARRQVGYGRGKRMLIEKDKAKITSGVRWGKTLGSPIALTIKNRDWENWQKIMSPNKEDEEQDIFVTQPRPGHADLAGVLKYCQKDIRNILERSSARETAARVAVGSVCKGLLKEFDIEIFSYVVELGGIKADIPSLSPRKIFSVSEKSLLHCPDKTAEKKMKERIDEAKANGDTIGGIAEIVITGIPPGLGSHVHWDRKLDGRLARALMSIQAVKGVEVGIGFDASRRPGSKVHDEIFYQAGESKNKAAFYRSTNRAGGIEGGMTNGENIVLRIAMKPISTLYSPLKSVDIKSKNPIAATVERSDICRVPSVGVIGEAAAAFEVARAFLEKFGGDSLLEIKRNYEAYQEYLANF